jgi:hypothetical protein
MSYTLTSHFGIPHGHAAALTVGPFIRATAARGRRPLRDGTGDRSRARSAPHFAGFTAGDSGSFEPSGCSGRLNIRRWRDGQFRVILFHVGFG